MQNKFLVKQTAKLYWFIRQSVQMGIINANIQSALDDFIYDKNIKIEPIDI